MDLVRDAVAVPGVKVIATARRDFGIDEPSWLPAAAIEQLGRAAPVVIEELAESEVQELRHAAPRLLALLSDAHPARDVVRNLYRLARLAHRPANDPMPRTEVEMARQWWTTADGTQDGTFRERGRLLRAMAAHALDTGASFDASGAPPAAIEALVKSESLRDLGNDRVAFRHDVLREWAIANLLDAVPNTIEGVKLDAVASPSLSRSIDLAARMKLEGATDSTSWLAWLNTMSRPGAHLSLRRAALLAVVRSEIAATLLDRVADALLQDDAKLLVELVRTIKAVDVTPAAKLFAQAGVDPALVPAGLTIPSAPSWQRWPLVPSTLRQLSRPSLNIRSAVELLASFRIGGGRNGVQSLRVAFNPRARPNKWRPSMKADAGVASTCSLLDVLVSRASRIPLNTRRWPDFRPAIYERIPLEMVIPFFQCLE